MTAQDHWEGIYAEGAPHEVSDSDRVGAAALAHLGDVRGKRLLDVGSGRGAYSIFFARHGAHVTALDASENATATLTRLDIPGVHPVSGDAFTIEGPYDLVFGQMILHHLEPFATFAGTLRTAIVPGGRGFFYENNAMSDTLMWCRRHLAGRGWIPKYGDADEYPLQSSEVDLLREHFTVEVEYPEMFMARLASAYLLRGRGKDAATRLDESLYRIRFLRRFSYRQYVKLSA